MHRGGEGGERHEGGGEQIVQPTIFADVSNNMTIAREEIFGPRLSVIPFKDEDHAAQIGNDSLYGLASGVWSENLNRALSVADRIDAGTVWVNMYRASAFMMPMTGCKDSGLGSENCMDNIRDYFRTKAI